MISKKWLFFPMKISPYSIVSHIKYNKNIAIFAMWTNSCEFKACESCFMHVSMDQNHFYSFENALQILTAKSQPQ